MTRVLLRDLAWLPRAPASFNHECKELLEDCKGRIGRRIQRLAGYALDTNQLIRIDKLLGRARAEKRPLEPLVPLRLAYLSNGTSSLIGPALVASAARHGIALELFQAGYDQAAQEALQTGSRLQRFAPDLALLSINYAGLPLGSVLGDAAASEAAVAAAIDYLETLAAGIRRACGATVIFESVARPAESVFGSLDFRVPGAPRQIVDAFNRALVENLRGSANLLLDVAALAEAVGLAEWHDPVQWHLAKLPFGQQMVPLYADHVARLLGAVRGKSRKCLVLDLDDTLWGGVVGDDGLEGITLGQGSPLGEAFLAVQRMALVLRDRGVLLAVCSKNEEAVARAPFRQHPDMLLKEEHIAVFQANWLDKASNLAAIARTLSLGTDALVFLDDNPAEREQVRQALPEVAVPELPGDVALVPRLVMAAGYFESIAFSAEDRQRAGYYRANAERRTLLKETVNLDAYLRSLDMTISFRPFDAVGRDRIVQLINKSNQFNLTTHRYTASDVEAIEGDRDCHSLQVRLADRFGDNGMISVVVCRKQENTWEIDTWLMSCRVLGRRVEEAVLQEIAGSARSEGATRLVGRYIPSGRNQLVEDHYAKLGFALLGQDEEGGTLWSLDLGSLEKVDLPMEVRRTELVAASGGREVLSPGPKGSRGCAGQ